MDDIEFLAAQDRAHAALRKAVASVVLGSDKDVDDATHIIAQRLGEQGIALAIFLDDENDYPTLMH